MSDKPAELYGQAPDADFKAYVHRRLDEAGVPADPDSPHKASGCRIGGRLDWLFDVLGGIRRENTPLPAEAFTLAHLVGLVHKANAKWWVDLNTGEPIKRNVGELLMLTVSELAEAMEGHRKGLMDDKLPHRSMLEVELADAVIRILDIAGGLKLDLGGAFVEKMAYNATRQDHTHEARKAQGGKKY